MTTFDEVMTSLGLRFESGNSVQVQSARITKEEWEIIQNEIEGLVCYLDLGEALYQYQINGDK